MSKEALIKYNWSKLLVFILFVFGMVIACELFQKDPTFMTMKAVEYPELVSNNEPIINVMGTIEFPKYNQVNKITLGTEDEILDKGYVGMHRLSDTLDKYPNNIVLAAHNRKGLFRIIEKLKYNDIVNVSSMNNIYTFKVIKIEEVSADELMDYIKIENKRILTLITCTDKNKKRLVITLIENSV